MKTVFLVLLCLAVASAISVVKRSHAKDDGEYVPVTISRYAGQTPDVREYDSYNFEDTMSTNLDEFVKAKQLIIDADAKHSDTENYVEMECGKAVCGPPEVYARAVGSLSDTGINTRQSVKTLGSTGY
eukprot:CAMPEP_0175148306 /NCGR_PEP_ID=MMETSP0087-20121206/16545_1 /TAXON_ID=136419 /ORGANISM="Unknown Unknown, Strain D1" /LENGTH=127 /DNA_ID=CAMNT_0016433733 /DNA_START=22 /DNA_END=405 /DNA_ORIENTATION=+